MLGECVLYARFDYQVNHMRVLNAQTAKYYRNASLSLG